MNAHLLNESPTAEMSPLGVCLMNADYRIISCNEAFSSLLRVAPESVSVNDLFPAAADKMMADGFLPIDAAGLLLKILFECQATGRDQEGRLLLADRIERSARCAVLPQTGYVLLLSDRRQAAADSAPAISTDRLSEVVSNLPHGVAMFGPDERLIVCNAQYLSCYGLDAAIVRPGIAYREVLAHWIAHSGHAGLSLDNFYATRLGENRDRHRATVYETVADGRAIRITTRALQDGGWVSLHEDATAQIEADRRIAHLANHDALTNLPNRHSFHIAFSKIVDEAKMRRGEIAVLYTDLDRFKQANDAYGHLVGDKLLIEVAARLRIAVRKGDLVARLGGDEFLIVQNGASRAIAGSSAQRLIKSISKPFSVCGHSVVMGLSVGIALAPQDGVDPEILLHRADQALYRAKARGRGGYAFFNEDCNPA